MRKTAYWIAFLVVGSAGCGERPPEPSLASPPAATLQLHTDLKVALHHAEQAGRPLLVLNILGDHRKQC